MVEDIEFRDEIDFGQEKTLSMNEIILRHVRKISDLCCKEFTGGFWEKKPIRTANGVMFSEVWHDDVREAYSNAVDFLVDLIYPMGDDTLKNYLKEYENFCENVEEKTDCNKIDIKEKIKLKRQTFQQINLMFERMNFFKGIGVSNE